MRVFIACKIGAVQVAQHWEGRGATGRPSAAHPRGKRSSVQVLAWGRKGTGKVVESMPAHQPSPLAGQPAFVRIGLALLAVAALVQLIRKFAKRGSMGNLENRGLLTEGAQNTASDDPFFTSGVFEMMRNVNTVQYEELSQEQIEAARRRRSQDRRSNETVDLSKIQLPANHPFAISKEISDEEEQLQMARLHVRRGMPLKDVDELKARQMRAQQQQQQSPYGGRESQERRGESPGYNRAAGRKGTDMT